MLISIIRVGIYTKKANSLSRVAYLVKIFYKGYNIYIGANN